MAIPTLEPTLVARLTQHTVAKVPSPIRFDKQSNERSATGGRRFRTWSNTEWLGTLIVKPPRICSETTAGSVFACLGQVHLGRYDARRCLRPANRFPTVKSRQSAAVRSKCLGALRAGGLEDLGEYLIDGRNESAIGDQAHGSLDLDA